MPHLIVFRALPAALALALLVAGCAGPRNWRFEDPETRAELDAAWRQGRHDFPPLPRVDYHTPLYAEYLEGVRIMLDPGHGGDAHLDGYKRGPTNVREAVMNLGVALELRAMLESAGAEVRLTREEDVDVSLAERVRMANEWPADLFISLHHNAASRPSANFTSVWFHDQPDHNPANLDLARYLAQGLADALRLPEVAANPLKSDSLMYPQGFGVLRPLEVTGCLTEASFFTHPYEEYRLSRPDYWKREAYGLFLALARYAWAGLPDSELLTPNQGRTTQRQPEVRVQLRTGLEQRAGWGVNRPWVFWDEVKVWLNGTPAAHVADTTQGQVWLQPTAPLPPGEHRVRVHYRNYNGNACRYREHLFLVAPPPEVVRLTRLDPTTIQVTALTDDRQPVLDDTPIALGGRGVDVTPFQVHTLGGSATATIRPHGKGWSVFAVCEGVLGWLEDE